MPFPIRGCVRAALLSLALLSGCTRREPPAPAPSGPAVYVDPKTLDAFQGPATLSLPAVNPKTGKETLVAALYCSACKKWHAVPPLEVLQRNPRARQCPKTGVPLSAEGPLPEAILPVAPP
jgi:hypothetical protein